MIIVSSTVTADNTDLLAATDLANIPRDGQLDIFIASTQNDTTLTITGPGVEAPIRTQKLQLRTNGMPLLSDDLPISIPVTQGAHYILNLDIVTAATANMIAIWRGLEELI